MSGYDGVLFLHIAVVLSAFALAGTLHTSEWLMAGAKSVAELRVAAKPQKWGVAFVPIIFLLLALGMWLVHLSQDEAGKHFNLGDGWVWTAMVALVILFATGGGIMGRYAAALGKALDSAADGPVPAELRAQALAPVPTYVGNMNTFLAAAVVFNMVNKPGTGGALLTLGIGIAVGLAVGRLMQAHASPVTV